MITFMYDKLPNFIRIPGEAERTKVYEYKDQPMLCKKCWKYGHTEKRCLSQVVLCGNVLDQDISLVAASVRQRNVAVVEELTSLDPHPAWTGRKNKQYYKFKNNKKLDEHQHDRQSKQELISIHVQKKGNLMLDIQIQKLILMRNESCLFKVEKKPTY